MTDSKHTPGPWIIDPKYLSEVQTSSMLTVATCWHEHAAGQTIDVVGVVECSLEESAANARIIAAAPELLECLKDARRLLTDQDAIDLAHIDEVIAKAEGAVA